MTRPYLSQRIFADSSSMVYPAGSGRDLRIDFIRGWVMAILIINHTQIVSLWNYLVWERVGVVSGGEGFVLISGVVLGLVYRRKWKQEGAEYCTKALVRRASQLYRVNLGVILAVFLLSLNPFWDAAVIMEYRDFGSDKIFPLYPQGDIQPLLWLARMTLLKFGPHQIQILGLYVVLIGLTPVILFVMSKGLTPQVLAVSAVIYLKNTAFPERITGAQFEYGFPLLAWQILFVYGLAAGFHWHKIADWLTPVRKKWLVFVSGTLTLIFLFYTLNNPLPELPGGFKLTVIPSDIFYELYQLYFMKNSLGILRVINYVVLLVIIYLFLTRFWGIFNRLLGWYLVPVGQATLYVFVIHVFLVFLVDQVPQFNQGNLWWNTLAHTSSLMIPWLLVRYKVAFRWIPR